MANGNVTIGKDSNGKYSIEVKDAYGNNISVPLSSIPGIDNLGINPSLSSFHAYQVSYTIGPMTQNGPFTLDSVFGSLDQNPAPGINSLTGVATGDIASVPGLGPVTFSVNPTGYNITNITTPNHELYPGVVFQQLYTQNNEVEIQTTGLGNGPYGALNSYLAGIVWSNNDYRISTSIFDLLAGIKEQLRDIYDGQIDLPDTDITNAVSSFVSNLGVDDVGSGTNSDNAQGPADNTNSSGIMGGIDDPLVLNLSGGTVHTTDLATNGVTFDVNGTGNPIKTGWITAGEAFLVEDGSNVPITKGGQMIANFGQLSAFDTNHDGQLSAAEANAAGLKLWLAQGDAGGHNVGKLESLSQAGIAAITIQAQTTGSCRQEGVRRCDRRGDPPQ